MDKDYYNMNMGYGFDPNIDQNNMDNNMFNPIIQYEQAYMYYRYLSQQMDYKIKCKEYEKMTSSSDTSRNYSRKIE